jgi:HU-like DNA-binding protein/uncharacterized protein with Ig-like fold DUF4469
MALKFALFENHLTSAPGDYMAVTTDNVSVGREEIIERMIRSGSTVTKAEALSVLEEYSRALEEHLMEGNNVVTPLYRISQSISGVFDSRSEAFKKEKHRININIHPGLRLREIRSQIAVERVEGTPAHPVPIDFKDVVSDSMNDVLTPGGVGELTGNDLKFDPAQSDQGIFLIAGDGTITRVSTIVRNKPSNLIFMITDGLATGNYSLEVRSVLPGTKNIRTGLLDAELTVS